MKNDVYVISITPSGHNRIVRMIDVRNGRQRELTYGDSVTERWIRFMAPRLWRSAKPIKQ
ncbi:hypothetical protein [Paenibacillus durus]|uniref:Uncharacterized protein n=1 Tax=Paenibacillus durus ATCC 35681 TaxID=1333534 RepID=A0A0F7FBM0_PAEDU|nr:hypothetical protein [Paenibacillus durus]AKG35647.1 hypothetical protein VK70_14570 [Paenibacillus durus ATCC 35681]